MAREAVPTKLWTLHPFVYRRRPTRVVHVGDVALGGANPIRVQSMTTPATTDTAATVAQIVRLMAAGCEIVRLTVPTGADADNIPNIRSKLRALGIRVPLVADIHFTPKAAMLAAEHVEKVRINPGNFADKKKFAVRDYSDAEYESELARLEKVFSPLVRRCKELGVSMRIGTNHGSLSDRILNRFGDTPEGMVESALEFVRICEAHGYRELVISMKASNPVVALEAYRLLAIRMGEEQMDYPFHLGVTEAGDGEDGRIKSAMGIGALLAEGIGDTVRVSLTEDPVEEIPVAQALVAPYNRMLSSLAFDTAPVGAGKSHPRGPALPAGAGENAAWQDAAELFSPVRYERRESLSVRVGPRELGGGAPVLVEVPLRTPLSDSDGIRRELDRQAGVRVPQETRAELVSVDLPSWDLLEALVRLRASMELVAPQVALSARLPEFTNSDLDPPRLEALFAACHRVHVRIDARRPGAVSSVAQMLDHSARSRAALLVEATAGDGVAAVAAAFAVDCAREAARRSGSRLLLSMDPGLLPSPLQSGRLLALWLKAQHLRTPMVLIDRPGARNQDPILGAPAALGGLLCEGIGDAIHLETASAEDSRRLAFGILQGARIRMTRTEFISCPSCGRTLFDLETTTARIKSRTAHLKGLKIAVMGCIVNGPGEMADADFGYVGWGDEKIALFVGKDMVEKDIPTSQADDRLVELIRRHGKWEDPPEPTGPQG